MILLDTYGKILLANIPIILNKKLNHFYKIIILFNTPFSLKYYVFRAACILNGD